MLELMARLADFVSYGATQQDMQQAVLRHALQPKPEPYFILIFFAR